VVSTTRPETIIGDTAVAVHPNDERYTHLLNRQVLLEHPLRDDLIPLVADSQCVDPEFGTGAVKITPGHDPKDFAVGQRLSLPTLTVIDEAGHICFPNDTSQFRLNKVGLELLVVDYCVRYNSRGVPLQ
jgi:valyl-tRNA synthetase